MTPDGHQWPSVAIKGHHLIQEEEQREKDSRDQSEIPVGWLELEHVDEERSPSAQLEAPGHREAREGADVLENWQQRQGREAHDHRRGAKVRDALTPFA